MPQDLKPKPAAAGSPEPGDPPAAARGVMLQGLPPILDASTRVLILGSFPGVASLQAGQYYAHPRNHFWRILGDLFSTPALPHDYAGRCQWLLAQGLGVWDVYACCQREGSLDSAIRQARPNPLHLLEQMCPQLALIAHNGAQSYLQQQRGRVPGVPATRLPSSSPANASWSYQRKLCAWRDALAPLLPVQSGQDSPPCA